MSDVPFSEAIIFDLDDTILDDSGGVELAWHATCVEAAGQVRGLDPEALYRSILEVRAWFWSDPERHRVHRQDLRAASATVVCEALSRIGQANVSLGEMIGHAYRDRRIAAIQPFPGAIATLEILRRRGVRLALLTNGNGAAQRAKIDRFDLARHFDCIIIEGEFGVGKPDERVYAAAMQRLESRPSTTWIVGDNLDWEVRVPRGLGLHTIWVDGAGRGLPIDVAVQPHRIIRAISELV